MELSFNKTKFWQVPQPSGDGSWKPKKKRVSQVKFYNEYYPTSHNIFDKSWYKDIFITDKEGKLVKIHEVNRVAIPIQQMSVDIILAHLLGNKTHLSDATLKENPSLPFYKEYWNTTNIDTSIYQFAKSLLSLGDSAALFYKEGGKLNVQVLSMFYDDDFNAEYDKYGKMTRFYKFYDDKCDVYDNSNVETYQQKDKWVLVEKVPHGFKGIPVVYRKREEGAFWSRAQTNIENMEKMLSRLSEDNRAKFKSLYHLSTNSPQSVKTQSAGMTDIVVTDTDGDFKLIPPASLSEQFKFEFDTQLEMVFNSLGIVFPKHKSSGDMPTGSMKMMFYPTERVVKPLIHELDSAIDEINEIVKQGFAMEHSEHITNLNKGNIRACIQLFTPQDDAEKVESIVKLRKEKIISDETAGEESPYSANNESVRKEKERKAALAQQRELENMRMPFQQLSEEE